MDYIYCNCSKNGAEYRTIQILVIDDDESTQKIFSNKLFKKYDIEVVPNASIGLGKCLSRAFDLIFLSENKLKLTKSFKSKFLKTLKKLRINIPPVFLLTKTLKEIDYDNIYALIQKPINDIDIYNLLEYLRKNPNYSLKKVIN